MKVFLWSILLVIFHPDTQAKLIRVGKNQPNSSITAAIKLANPGDTILVSKGLYKEGNILINKSVSLIGEDYPILDGQNKSEVVSIKASNVLLHGFQVQHSGYATLEDPAGIKVYESANVTISNNKVYDTFFGIYLQYARRCHVLNNDLKGVAIKEQEIGNGIHCWKSDSLHIENNEITGHRDGIYFEFVTESHIKGNLSYNNQRYGLHFMFSHNDSYISNAFRNNGAGVAVMFTHGVTMINNRFEQNWGDAAYGILLKEISDSKIIGNHFSKNTVGILMDGASRVYIEKNTFNNNGWALKIQANCMDVTVIRNNFLGNTFDVSTNGSLVLNHFNGNYWDKYEGYDLNKDKIGDVPYRPISLYSVIIEQMPSAMLLFRSIMVSLLDKVEKLIPTLTPENLVDEKPCMKPLKL